MKLLVDSCSYNCQNVGDLAMLAVATSRLRALWPAATIRVITNAPQIVTAQCSGVTTTPVRGRRLLLQEPLFASADRLLPQPLSTRWTRIENQLRSRWPLLFRASLRLKYGLTGRDTLDINAFLDAVDEADLLVVSGAGILTDAFRDNALGILATLDMVQQRRVPTAMVGQGVGPIHDPELRRRAAAILSRVDLIAVREKLASLPLLRSLGVDPARILVTGDDAIEMASDTLRKPLDDSNSASSKIGVSLRVASYSEVGSDLVDLLRRVLSEASRVHEGKLVPIPIARHGGRMDVSTLCELLANTGAEHQDSRLLDTPQKVIARIGECRLVVTGTYHGAVFALAQGIPAVTLAKSKYYIDKFQGLADQFAAGCEVVQLEGPELGRRIAKAITRAWANAARWRPALLTASTDQVRRGRAAYARLFDLAETSAHSLPVKANPSPGFLRSRPESKREEAYSREPTRHDRCRWRVR